MTWLAAAAVLCADTLFLWMFLAVAPLEQLADAGAAGVSREKVYRFAADWRHGMAGNAPLYMPGFFVIAAAAWYATRRQPPGRLVAELAAILLAALAMAIVASPIGVAIAAGDFAQRFQVHVATTSGASMTAVVAALYTTVVWTSFVVASRYALRTRSLGPLAPVAVLTIGLALLRPWTVGDFTALWTSRTSHGDLVAIVSMIVVLAFGVMLPLSELRPHLIQTCISRLRIGTEK